MSRNCYVIYPRLPRQQNFRPQGTINAMRSRLTPVERFPDVLQHPVAAFRFIRRLITDWDHLTNAKSEGGSNFIENNLRDLRHTISKWRAWPTKTSLRNAALGLIRIGQVYSLYPSLPASSYTLDPVIVEKNCNRTGKHSILSGAFKSKYSQCYSLQDERNDTHLSSLYQSPNLKFNDPNSSDDSDQTLVSQTEKLSFSATSNKGSDYYVKWLPSPFDRDCRWNSYSRIKRSLPKNLELQGDTKKFSHNYLTTEDMLFIAKVARENQFCKEAKIWSELAKLSAKSKGQKTDPHDSLSIAPTDTAHRDWMQPLYSEQNSEKCPLEKGEQRSKQCRLMGIK
ncbi:hypothetical protein PoB_000873500 [Plakobranchus ocellatus]|uniref:Prolyl 4-hydroxylase N-terminal domain-containing protein n=1 Tax=Plakobranchus ocellatus TaxID=259542 RepID=A0AAV3YHM3_9GAST|nr:hypothetical protein PoB_000873500 [Plakobranchus ocellatus]